MDAVVAYDVRTVGRDGERRLVRVAKICERYGVRVQNSVFEVRLSEMQLQRLLGDLLDVIERTEDTVLIYRMSGDLFSSRIQLGRQTGHRLGAPWIF